MCKCSNCKFAGEEDWNLVHCNLFNEWIDIKYAECEELTCEGYIDRLYDGCAQEP